MDNTGCIGNTIITDSGLYFDYSNPRPEQIHVSDIAVALSNTCRFGGHSKFYSVAEHCCHCADIATKMGFDRKVIMLALMHDAAEAYIGDMPKPLKNMMPEFRSLELKVETAIYSALGIDTSESKAIKSIDMMMLKAEKLYLFPGDKEQWTGFGDICAPDISIYCWSPYDAESEFIERYFDIAA